MSTKLYVSNLAIEVTEPELESLFAEIGTCNSARLIKDRDTGRSRGFAFVEMESNADACRARKQLAGHDMRGRAIGVDVIIQNDDASGAKRSPARAARRR